MNDISLLVYTIPSLSFHQLIGNVLFPLLACSAHIPKIQKAGLDRKPETIKRSVRVIGKDFNFSSKKKQLLLPEN